MLKRSKMKKKKNNLKRGNKVDEMVKSISKELKKKSGNKSVINYDKGLIKNEKRKKNNKMNF